MLSDTVKDVLEEHILKINHYIELHGENLKCLYLENHEVDGLGYGSAPYILDDGDSALFIASEDGQYQPLEPFFQITEESVDENFDTIYSIPSDIGLLRFIPANPDFDFPVLSPEEFIVDTELFDFAGDLWVNYVESLKELSDRKLCAYLYDFQKNLAEFTSEHEIDEPALLFKSPVSLTAINNLMHQTINESNDRMVDALQGVIEDTDN